MKALGLVAGPRKGQTTDSLTDAVLRGLKDAGAEIEKVYLYDLSIKPCVSCYKCKGTGHCAIEDDDYPALIAKFNDADIVVFSSPTYVSNVTSVAKKFMDRGLSLFSPGKTGPRRTSPKPSKVILITSCGAPFPFSHLLGIIPGCLRAMKAFFGRMPVKIRTLAATGMDEFDSLRYAQLVRKAYNLGKSF